MAWTRDLVRTARSRACSRCSRPRSRPAKATGPLLPVDALFHVSGTRADRGRQPTRSAASSATCSRSAREPRRSCALRHHRLRRRGRRRDQHASPSGCSSTPTSRRGSGAGASASSRARCPRTSPAWPRPSGARWAAGSSRPRTWQRPSPTPSSGSAFDKRLGAFLDGILQRERGSLRDLLPAPDGGRWSGLLAEASRWAGPPPGVPRLRALRGGRGAAGRRAGGGGGRRAHRRRAHPGPGGRHGPSAVDEWLQGAVASDDFRRAVEDYLERGGQRLLEPERTFEEILPLGLVGAVERAIAGLPPPGHRAAGPPPGGPRDPGPLRDHPPRAVAPLPAGPEVPPARGGAAGDDRGHGGQGAGHHREGGGPAPRGDPAGSAPCRTPWPGASTTPMVDFLRRPVRSVLGGPDDPSVLDARATLAEWVVGTARDAGTREFLVEKLDAGPGEGRRPHVGRRAGAGAPGDRWRRGGEGGPERRGRAASTGRWGSASRRRLLDRPIGMPARLLPAEAPRPHRGRPGRPAVGVAPGAGAHGGGAHRRGAPGGGEGAGLPDAQDGGAGAEGHGPGTPPHRAAGLRPGRRHRRRAGGRRTARCRLGCAGPARRSLVVLAGFQLEAAAGGTRLADAGSSLEVCLQPVQRREVRFTFRLLPVAVGQEPVDLLVGLLVLAGQAEPDAQADGEQADPRIFTTSMA